MLNFEVDPALLAASVPTGTELDRWDGRTIVSMVGFHFRDTRVVGVPVPFHRHFVEVNLRFYVRRRDPRDGWRRGVVFVKEIAPRRAIAWVARRLYNERYVALPMRRDVLAPTDGVPGHATYAWRLGRRWHRLGAEIAGAAMPTVDGSEEQFVTEHYWGYVRQPDGSALEYQVEHPRWRVWHARATWFDCDVAALYGPAFAPFLAQPPRSAFVADGSAVMVRRGVPV